MLIEYPSKATALSTQFITELSPTGGSRKFLSWRMALIGEQRLIDVGRVSLSFIWTIVLARHYIGRSRWLTMSLQLLTGSSIAWVQRCTWRSTMSGAERFLSAHLLRMSDPQR